jgi:alpha-D-ribose 1-methylphosphonate 5-triphosphate diphosphatase PhnM
MHFDQRTQAALRDAGLSTDEISAVSEAVVEATREDADRLESFFADRETVYSDMDRAHSTGDVQEHAVEYLDLYTHADDLRGYLRFDSWGVYVAGGRVLSDDVVELTLGPTVHDRVRFAADGDAL